MKTSSLWEAKPNARRPASFVWKERITLSVTAISFISALRSECARSVRFRGGTRMFERSNFGPGLRAGFVRQLFGALSLLVIAVNPLYANPYLAKPGERPIPIRIATCAVSGGFTHLYAALDNNLFDKYGFKMEHVYIRGS